MPQRTCQKPKPRRRRSQTTTLPRKGETLEKYLRRWQRNAMWNVVVDMEEEGLIDLGDTTREGAKDFLEN